MDKKNNSTVKKGTPPMKIAVVGCGVMAQNHVKYILKTPGVKLVAVCDQSELRAQEMARRYNLPYYKSLTRLLKESQPDVVHIVTPCQTHAALSIQSLESGCHVFVEKPLCLTLEEVQAIYAASNKAGRLVSVDHTFLWSSLIQKALLEVDSGRLGRILHLQYIMGDDYLETVKAGYARWALELRGGVLCDIIPHPLYLIRAFLPGIQVVSTRATGTDIYDLRELWVDFAAGGAGASLLMSLNQRPLEHKISLYCERGTLHVDLRNFCIAVIPERNLPGPIARLVNTLSESLQRGMGTLMNGFGVVLGQFDPRAGVGGAIRAFYQAVTEGKALPVNVEDAKAVVEISTKIWDLIENTLGTLFPVVDGKGAIVVNKTLGDFDNREENNPPKVLVTGGTGFIGGHLVRRLVSEGRRVRVLCRPRCNLNGLPTQGVELVFGEVSDIDSVQRAMQGIEVLYHLAATLGGDWATHYQSTVIGTRNVFQSAVEAGVRKVIYVSSLSVLDSNSYPSKGVVNENHRLERKPELRGYYPRAKIEAECIAHEFIKRYKLPICIVRPGFVYGPGNAKFMSDAGFCIGNMLVLVVGLGGRRLGTTYVGNLVDALLQSEQNEKSVGRTYHVVDSDLPNVRNYIRTYRKVTGQRLKAFYLPVFFWTCGFKLLDVLLWLLRGSSPNLTYRLGSIKNGPIFSTVRAKDDLGWVAKEKFEKAMEHTFS